MRVFLSLGFFFLALRSGSGLIRGRLSCEQVFVTLRFSWGRWHGGLDGSVIGMIDTAISGNSLIYTLTNVINVFDTRTNVFSITLAVVKSQKEKKKTWAWDLCCSHYPPFCPRKDPVMRMKSLGAFKQ